MGLSHPTKIVQIVTNHWHIVLCLSILDHYYISVWADKILLDRLIRLNRLSSLCKSCRYLYFLFLFYFLFFFFSALLRNCFLCWDHVTGDCFHTWCDPACSSRVDKTLNHRHVFAFAQICAKFDLLKVSALLILLSFLFHHAAAPQY